MNGKARLQHLLGVGVVMVVPMLFAQPAIAQPVPCDKQHVFHHSNVWQVLPNDTDDTANLQCAFNQAVNLPGSAVQLFSGTYHAGQVAVTGFVGSFVGAGMNNTIVKTLDYQLPIVNPTNFWVYLPTPENGSNPWPAIFAFVGGDIVISDLSLYATANSGTTGWGIPNMYGTYPFYELALGFVILGSGGDGVTYVEANAEVDRVHIEGLPSNDSYYGYNLINATNFEGWLGAMLPLRGRFGVHDSEFRQVGGTNVYNLTGSQVSITGNSYQDSFEGMDIGSLVNTTYEYANNEALRICQTGVFLYGPFASSSLLIQSNTFTGGTCPYLKLADGFPPSSNGPYFPDGVTFSGKMTCQLLNNQITKENGSDIYLGSGTTGCLVMCKTPDETVVNNGTNNTVIGCHLPK